MWFVLPYPHKSGLCEGHVSRKLWARNVMNNFHLKAFLGVLVKNNERNYLSPRSVL